MKIETEFNMYDKVYIIDKGTIIESVIQQIEVNWKNDSVTPKGISINVYYWASNYRSWLKCIDMFRTKEGAAEKWLENQGLEVGIK